MRYIPQVSSFVLKRVLRIGDTHVVMVGTDCVSVGQSIEYVHVFLVSKTTQRLTSFAVAAEVNTYNRQAKEEGKIPADQSIVALGVFPCDGTATHYNLGFSDDYLDLDIFTRTALKVTMDRLSLAGPVMHKNLPPEEQERIQFM